MKLAILRTGARKESIAIGKNTISIKKPVKKTIKKKSNLTKEEFGKVKSYLKKKKK